MAGVVQGIVIQQPTFVCQSQQQQTHLPKHQLEHPQKHQPKHRPKHPQKHRQFVHMIGVQIHAKVPVPAEHVCQRRSIHAHVKHPAKQVE